MYDIFRLFCCIRRAFIMLQIKKTLLIAMLGFTYPFMTFSTDLSTDLFDKNKGIEVNADMVQTFKHYDEYLKGSIKALEECYQADDKDIHSYFEPCSRVWQIMNKPANTVLRSKIQDFFGNIIDKGLVEQHGEDAVKNMLEEKVGVPLIEKMKKETDLLHNCGLQHGKLKKTHKKMESDTDTRKFNAYLPRILGDICERNTKWGIENECKELRGSFHLREMDLRGEYSPFSFREDLYLKFNIKGIVRDLELSAQTTAELIHLTLQGCNGDGKCEAGPVLNYAQEAQYDRQINEQFPELLRDHCNTYPRSSDCAILREMVYDAQNPSKRINPMRDDNWRVARSFIYDLFAKDRQLIKYSNKETDGDLCSSTMDRFGCRSEDEIAQCAKDFKKSLYNQTMANNVQDILANFKPLNDFFYHITQDGLLIVKTENLHPRVLKREQTFDFSHDLEKVLEQEYGVDKNNHPKYKPGHWIVSQPVGERYWGAVCGWVKDDVDYEKKKELEVLVEETHLKIKKMENKKK